MKKVARWVLYNGVGLALGIAGLLYGLDWAKNIFFFGIWIFIIFGTCATLMFLVMYAGDEDKVRFALKNVDAQRRWRIASRVYDLVIISLLAGNGYFFTACGWVEQVLMLEIIYYMVKPKEEKNA